MVLSRRPTANSIFKQIEHILTPEGYRFIRMYNVDSFLIEWDNSYNMALSVSISLIKKIEYQIDTALFDKNSNDLVYNSLIRYPDIRTFGTVEELVNEVYRVKSAISLMPPPITSYYKELGPPGGIIFN